MISNIKKVGLVFLSISFLSVVMSNQVEARDYESKKHKKNSKQEIHNYYSDNSNVASFFLGALLGSNLNHSRREYKHNNYYSKRGRGEWRERRRNDYKSEVVVKKIVIKERPRYHDYYYERSMPTTVCYR